MVASNMTIGVDLLTTPPLGLNRVLIYAARLSRLDTVWAVDHWQGPIPTAIASQEEYAAKLQIIQNTAQEAGRDPQAITPALVQNIDLFFCKPCKRKSADQRVEGLVPHWRFCNTIRILI